MAVKVVSANHDASEAVIFVERMGGKTIQVVWPTVGLMETSLNRSTKSS